MVLALEVGWLKEGAGFSDCSHPLVWYCDWIACVWVAMCGNVVYGMWSGCDMSQSVFVRGKKKFKVCHA